MSNYRECEERWGVSLVGLAIFFGEMERWRDEKK
jgi:hypothetical protein